MSTHKLCKDCRHFVDDSGGWCYRPIATTDLVYGTYTEQLNRYARDERQPAPEADICGPEGRYWEDRHKGQKPGNIVPLKKGGKA